MKPKETYYISTGKKGCYYTLRHKFYEASGGYVLNGVWMGGRWILRDWHVATLSTDRDKAIEKAKEWAKSLNLDYVPEIRAEPTNDIRRRKSEEIDHSIIRFGKYYGKTVHEVMELDPDYLKWAILNISSKQHSKTLYMAYELMKEDIDQLRKGAEEEENRIEKLREKRAGIFRELSVRLFNSKNCFVGSFKHDVATSLGVGETISPKAEKIVADILAKEKGRRNSKAYETEYDRIMDIFEKAEEVLL